MRYPSSLKKGGTIGFAAPSFGCTIEPYHTAFLHAVDRFRQAGFQTLYGPNVFADDGIGISSTPQNCGNEITSMFTGAKADVILSCGGGELMENKAAWHHKVPTAEEYAIIKADLEARREAALHE